MRKNDHRPATLRRAAERLHPGRGGIRYCHYQRNTERGCCDRDWIESMDKIGWRRRRVQCERGAGPKRGYRVTGYRRVAIIIDNKLAHIDIGITARHRARRQHAKRIQNRERTSYRRTREWSDHGALCHGLGGGRGHDVADRLGAEIGAGNNCCRVHAYRPRDRQMSSDQLPQPILRGVGQGNTGQGRIAQPGIIGVRRSRGSKCVGNAIRHQHEV